MRQTMNRLKSIVEIKHFIVKILKKIREDMLPLNHIQN